MIRGALRPESKDFCRGGNNQDVPEEGQLPTNGRLW